MRLALKPESASINRSSASSTQASKLASTNTDIARRSIDDLILSLQQSLDETNGRQGHQPRMNTRRKPCLTPTSSPSGCPCVHSFRLQLKSVQRNQLRITCVQFFTVSLSGHSTHSPPSLVPSSCSVDWAVNFLEQATVLCTGWRYGAL